MAPLADSFFSMLLRIGELAFAAVVAGLTGEWLHANKHLSNHTWTKGRFIYTETVAGLSMLLALLWLLPFSGGFIHWPVDLFLSILWFVSFGLLVAFIGPLHCGSIFDWSDITHKGTCQKWKADVAFCFLSAIFWLASTVLGFWVMHRARRGHVVAGDGVGRTTTRRRWYSRSRV